MNLQLGRVNLGCSLVLMTLMGLIGGSSPLSAQEPQPSSSSEEVEDRDVGVPVALGGCWSVFARARLGT